jgi:hypothetical protein
MKWRPSSISAFACSRKPCARMRARATLVCSSVRSPRPILRFAIGSYPFFDQQHGPNTNVVLRARDAQKLVQAKREVEEMLERVRRAQSHSWTSPSHGENRGSSPLGSANDFKVLVPNYVCQLAASPTFLQWTLLQTISSRPPCVRVVRRCADDMGERRHRTRLEPRDRISASRLADAFRCRIRRSASAIRDVQALILANRRQRLPESP